MRKIHKKIYKKIYGLAEVTVLTPFCQLFIDLALTVAAGYFSVKKINDFSLTGWLVNHAFHQPLLNVLVQAAIWLLVAAIIAKLVSLGFQRFPPASLSAVDPDEISDCLMRMNLEIQNHLDKFEPYNLAGLKDLNEQHAFDVNTRAVVVALAEHIRRSIQSVALKRRDTFISLYAIEPCGEKLKYLLHYDPKRDIVKSRSIDLLGQTHAEYECVKCINLGQSTAYVINKKNYAKCDRTRYKTIRQYMGCKLCIEENVYGFLNIEFHNHTVFDDEEEMQNFMLEHVMPFKLLLEYQFLKKRFFEKLVEKEGK